jgi:hypothetical protein
MTKRQESQRSLSVDHATTSQTKTRIERELVGSEFTDVRLNKRFRKLFHSSPRAPGESIPLVCQDLANTKAAYRFLSNHRMNEGHSCWTLPIHTPAICSSTVLVLHDTTEFNYHRKDVGSVGILHRLPVARGSRLNGQLQHYVVCGIPIHSSLAVTTDGLPLGLTALKIWTRKQIHRLECSQKENQSHARAD